MFGINKLKSLFLYKYYNNKTLLLAKKVQPLDLNMPSFNTILYSQRTEFTFSTPLSGSLFPFLSSLVSLHLSVLPKLRGALFLRDWNHTGDLELAGLEEAVLSLVAIPFCRADPKIKVQNRQRIKETIHHTS